MHNLPSLKGRKGLIAGIANEHSIAFGCAKAMHSAGEDLLMTYGAEKVVDHCSMMGPMKAAQESATRYMVVELGAKGIRVHAISPGPLETRAAAGIKHFDQLLEQAAAEAPRQQLVSNDNVGAVATCLVSDAAAALTGHTAYVDTGLRIRA